MVTTDDCEVDVEFVERVVDSLAAVVVDVAGV